MLLEAGRQVCPRRRTDFRRIAIVNRRRATRDDRKLNLPTQKWVGAACFWRWTSAGTLGIAASPFEAQKFVKEARLRNSPGGVPTWGPPSFSMFSKKDVRESRADCYH